MANQLETENARVRDYKIWKDRDPRQDIDHRKTSHDFNKYDRDWNGDRNLPIEQRDDVSLEFDEYSRDRNDDKNPPREKKDPSYKINRYGPKGEGGTDKKKGGEQKFRQSSRDERALCHFWPKGECRYGDYCRNWHGGTDGGFDSKKPENIKRNY